MLPSVLPGHEGHRPAGDALPASQRAEPLGPTSLDRDGRARRLRHPLLHPGALPPLHTGLAHKEAGVGQLGAGIVTAPSEVFLKAARFLAEQRAHT